MNKHGQTLIAFVIMIPALLLLIAFIVETGTIRKEKSRVESTTKTILETIETENIETKIKDLYQKNKIPTENIEIKNENNKLNITNQYEIKSLFGQIIGIKSYKIKLNMSRIEDNGIQKIIKE